MVLVGGRIKVTLAMQMQSIAIYVEMQFDTKVSKCFFSHESVNFARSHVRVAAALRVSLVISLILTRLALLLGRFGRSLCLVLGVPSCLHLCVKLQLLLVQ